MSTFKEIVYLCLDELKLVSDDASYTEEHIIYLASKYRTFVLKQRYSDIKKQIPDSNYQTICLTMTEVPAMAGCPCTLDAYYAKSTVKIPFIMSISNPRIYKEIYDIGNITYISKDRMRYVGYNRFIPKTIYSSIAPDNYLYFKAFEEIFSDDISIKFSAIFEDAVLASDLYCDKECDVLDRTFPLEDGLVPVVVELIVKELSGSIYKPKDSINNASDDLSNIPTS